MSTQADGSKAAVRGRPRSAEADVAILDAARDLLLETGYEGVTIEAVATRAGVGKATIYRRWSGKPELVVEVLGHTVRDMPMPDTGDTRTDLVQFVMAMVKGLVDSPLGGVIRSLSAEIRHNPELMEAFRGRFVNPRRAVARELVVRGIERGELRQSVDPDLVLDLLAGTLHHRLVFTGKPITTQLADQIVDLVWSGIAEIS